MANETQVPKSPPAPEVALRTLSSDAKSIAAGEVDPQPQLVSPTPISNQGRIIDSSTSEGSEEGQSSQKRSTGKKIILWSLAIILILAIIAVVIFWLLPKLSSGSNVEVTTPTQEN
ncbi:MAG: hypothetical protein Q8Q32_03285 [bacterium]|nr:hypothetical protein [bacterium]